jgi:hypothetical protein
VLKTGRGAPGAGSADILCSLDRAGVRYQGEVEEFVYFYIGEIAVADSSHFGTQFATLASFVDHRHLSVYTA